MREIIAAIDIGGSKIKLVVAEILNERFNILCALSEDSRGVKKGAICEPDETGYAIKKLLKKAEEMLGTKVSKAIVTVNEDSADFQIGDGSITYGRIVNLDTTSKDELKGYLKLLNDIDEKLIDDVNNLLVTLKK